MKGVVKYAPGVGQVDLRDVPEPVAGAGQVRIAIKAAGICGTDIHIYDGEYASRPPVILGHECAGQIDQVGAGVRGFAVGDRVTALPFAVTCGQCRYCRQEQFALCAQRQSFGSGVHGAFAPYLVIPASIVRRLPGNADFQTGALSEPLACCAKALLDEPTIQAGDTVLVTGPGAIGLLASQIAKLSGATVILIGTAHDRHRLELAKKLGIDHALETESRDVDELLSDLTAGEGVDTLVECSGAAEAIRNGLLQVRKQGQIFQVGLFGKPLQLDYEQIAYKDLKVRGSFSSSGSSWDRALNLLGGGLMQAAPLISDVLPLSRWKEGFGLTRRREGLKILLDPSLD